MLNSKKVNSLVIISLLGSSIAVIQSAFTLKVQSPNYGKLIVGGTVKWIPLAGLTERVTNSELRRHEYTCDLNVSETCTAYINSSTIPLNNTPDPIIVVNGNFRYKP